MHSLRYGSHDLFELAPEVEELVKAYVIDLKVPWQAELEFGFPKKRSLGMIFDGRKIVESHQNLVVELAFFFEVNLSKRPHFFVYD